LFLSISVSGAAAVAAQSRDLSGRVEAQGEPVGGAELSVSDDRGRVRARSTTSSEGSFSFSGLPSERLRLEVRASGFAEATTDLPAGASRDNLQIELEPEGLDTEITVTAALPDFLPSARVSGDRIEKRGAADLVEALRSESGLSAVRRGSVNLDPTVRGLQEGQVGMFVDGSRTFAAGPGRMDSGLSHVGPHGAQGVRVVKGPYALAWGAGAMSAIDVETFRPTFGGETLGLAGSLGLQYGDNGDVLDTIGGLWGSSELLRFQMSAGYREGSDYEAGNGSEIPGDFESMELRWGVGWQPRASLYLDYTGGYQAQDDLDYPGRLLDATLFRTHSHVVEMSALTGGGAELAAQLSLSLKDHEMNNDNKPTAQPAPGRMPPFGIDVYLPAKSDTFSGRFSWAEAVGDWRVKAGGDFYDLRQDATRTISRRPSGPVLFEDIVWPDADLQDVGLYVQGLRSYGSGQLGATLRFDRAEVSAGEVSDFFRDNTVGELDRDESDVSLAVSGVVEIGDDWLLSAGAGRAVRTASILERYSDRFPSTKFQLPAEFMGDPGLSAETSTELNLGLETGAGRLHLRLDTFYRVIDDYITVAADPSLPTRLPLSPPIVFRYVNGTEADFYGGELLLDQSVGDFFEWRGTLSYVRAQDELFDEPVLGIAPLTGVVELELHSRDRRYAVALLSTLVSGQDRVAVSRFEQPTPGYSTFDLRGTAQLRQGLSLRAGVENLTDKAYSHHLNSPNPFLRERVPEVGRSFFVGLRFEAR
jgi:iron complex outermembrane receptor protein